ncbi:MULTISPECIES: hypothetical protein [unclassified Lentimonas]|uniref:hypothetical protein n=1 Tax=unclassified Lentimonas TaxID=2630993 RepID=UPI0013260F56|nr:MULTISPECIES: hypothetical protein [unclassified Lentimonas]CAA6676475.1 Unannotated [Lentimonas sp. CC4]CAA6685315.1 Unannotated [Lentimonas sp. CC6]CAA7074961.1 Unannotated [Lentimonas sp. CC4]CAA7168358.1 Unannotated [Lentimonas sp. CC21]CAA7180602.1 Unannotated [Lentimonas sp. CC8]
MTKRILILPLLALLTLSACKGTKPSKGRGKGKHLTAAEFMTTLDKDGDGRVSKEEFDGPDQHFAQSDTNQDGYISVDEVPSGPPPRR